jgi:hypothetical protein
MTGEDVDPGAMGARSGDDWAVPLCHRHHGELHQHGNETRWWAMQGVDAEAWAKASWAYWSGLKNG